MSSKEGIFEFVKELKAQTVSMVTCVTDDMNCPIAYWTTIFEGSNISLRLGHDCLL